MPEYKFYEIATLSFDLLNKARVSNATNAWVHDPAAKGTVLGCWTPDIGILGRIIVLRGFVNSGDLSEESERTRSAADPWFAGEYLNAWELVSYKPFPFLPSVEPADMGGTYEIRSYLQKPGGLPITLAGWEKAIAPAKEYTKHLVVALSTTDGPPRITHIWGFSSFDQRRELRLRHYMNGTWPPKGGPENILQAESTIAYPEDWSPLK